MMDIEVDDTLEQWEHDMIPGWWRGTCFYFSIYWEFHHPN